MDLKNKKILVTGSDGFIGSHLTERLLRDGYKVRAFIYYNSFNSWGWLDDLPLDIKKSLEVFTGDIRDPHGVRAAMTDCNVVMHLAALISIPFSYHSPDAFIETNVKGTLNILQAARQLGVERIIHTSTSEVYGTAQFVPITENHPLNAQSPYAASKIGADQIAKSFYCTFGMPVTIIRPFNTYGPRQSARAVIPSIITQIANNNPTVKLGALHPTRDFTYVSDTVDAFIKIAESDEAVGEVINIGNNFEISIGETAQLISELMQTEIKIAGDAERLRPDKSEVNRLWADNTKAMKLTGWQPKYAGKEGFQKGLLETIRWFTHIENLLKYKADVCNI